MPTLQLSREEVRELDRRAWDEYSISGQLLMENAGRGAAELLRALGIHGQVLVCCGKGNNGGDGMVMARHLHFHGVPVQVYLLARPQELSSDAAKNLAILQESNVPVEVIVDIQAALPELAREFRRAEWLVDALFGTGLVGPIRPPYDELVRAMNESGARILAVDIPSGLDCDSGRPTSSTIRAQRTVTLVAPKKGFTAAEAQEWLGKVHVAEIGVPRRLIDDFVHSRSQS